MQELVKIMEVKIGSDMVNGCNARELHAKLQNGYKFSEWVERRFAEAQLLDGQDYIGFSEISEKPQGGRPAIEYHLSLDAAKEIAMLERNDIGKQVRKYFIEFEKKATAALRSIPAEMNALLADYERQLADLRQQMRLLTLRTAKPTNEQMAREFMKLKEIESVRAKQRMKEGGKIGGEKHGKGMVSLPGALPATDTVSLPGRESATEPSEGIARELAAIQLGVKPSTAERAANVVAKADELKAAGNERQANELLDILNTQSVNAAHKMMRSLARQAVAGA